MSRVLTASLKTCTRHSINASAGLQRLSRNIHPDFACAQVRIFCELWSCT
jgi:hypothetical protein